MAGLELANGGDRVAGEFGQLVKGQLAGEAPGLGKFVGFHVAVT